MLYQAEREPSGSNQDVLSRWYESMLIPPEELQRFVPEHLSQLSSQVIKRTELQPQALKELFEAYFFGETYHHVAHLRTLLKKLGYKPGTENTVLDAYMTTLGDTEPLPEEIFSEEEALQIKRAPFVGDESFLDSYRNSPSITQFIHELVLHSKSEWLGESYSVSFEDEFATSRGFASEISDQLPQIVMLPGVGYRFAVPVPLSLRFQKDRQIHQIAGEDLLIAAGSEVHERLLATVCQDQVLLSYFLKYSAAVEQLKRFDRAATIVGEALQRRKEQLNKHYGMLVSRLCTHFISLLKDQPTKLLLLYRGFLADKQDYEDDVLYRKLPYAYEYSAVPGKTQGEVIIKARVNTFVQQGRRAIDPVTKPGPLQEQFAVSTKLIKNEPLGWERKSRIDELLHYPLKHIVQYSIGESKEKDIQRKVEATFEHPAETDATHLLYSLFRPIAAVIEREKMRDLGSGYEMKMLALVAELENTNSVPEFLATVRRLKLEREVLEDVQEPELIAVPDKLGLAVTTTPFVPSGDQLSNN